MSKPPFLTMQILRHKLLRRSLLTVFLK